MHLHLSPNDPHLLAVVVVVVVAAISVVAFPNIPLCTSERLLNYQNQLQYQHEDRSNDVTLVKQNE
jgi:hypothetical protein